MDALNKKKSSKRNSIVITDVPDDVYGFITNASKENLRSMGNECLVRIKKTIEIKLS